MRRYLSAAVIVLSMIRLYSSAPSDGGRAACIFVAVAGVGALLYFSRRAAPRIEDDEDLDARDDEPGEALDVELLTGAAVRGRGMRSPGGTLVLTRRALRFTHARGELVLPVEQIAHADTGRTLAVFDNQLVLALRDGTREVFQISEDRDRWLALVRGVLPAARGAYR